MQDPFGSVPVYIRSYCSCAARIRTQQFHLNYLHIVFECGAMTDWAFIRRGGFLTPESEVVVPCPHGGPDAPVPSPLPAAPPRSPGPGRQLGLDLGG